MMVTELKSEALKVKECHWKQLMKRLRVMWQLHDLTLDRCLPEMYMDIEKYELWTHGMNCGPL